VCEVVVGHVTHVAVGLPSIAVSGMAPEDDVAVHAFVLVEDLDFTVGRDVSSHDDAIAAIIGQDVGSRSDAHKV